MQLTQRAAALSHANVTPLQSASVVQSPQVPVLGPDVTQTPTRHPVFVVQEPPDVMPQRLSDESHTPATHARVAIGAEQVPPGTVCPLGVLAVQVPAVVTLSHHSPDAQSLSRRHCSGDPQPADKDPDRVVLLIVQRAGGRHDRLCPTQAAINLFESLHAALDRDGTDRHMVADLHVAITELASPGSTAKRPPVT